MTEFVKRIHQHIETARRGGEFFTNGQELLALVPEAAHSLALGDINAYMASQPTVSYPFVKPESASSPATQTLVIMGVSCHVIRANVSSEMFVVGKPVVAEEEKQAA